MVTYQRKDRESYECKRTHYDDPIDENGCWFKENMALITWKDGDTKEFYLIELVDYKEV